MGGSRRKWGSGGAKVFRKMQEAVGEQVSGAKKIADSGVEAFLKLFDGKEWGVKIDMPRVRMKDVQKKTRELRKMVWDQTDEQTRFYTAILLPTLVANYFFGRYFGPMTAFLTKMQGVQLYTPTWYKYEKGVVKFDDTILT